MFAHIVGQKELMFSALDPASRLGSIEEGMSLSLEKYLKFRAGENYGMRIYALLESESPSSLPDCGEKSMEPQKNTKI